MNMVKRIPTYKLYGRQRDMPENMRMKLIQTTGETLILVPTTRMIRTYAGNMEDKGSTFINMQREGGNVIGATLKQVVPKTRMKRAESTYTDNIGHRTQDTWQWTQGI